MIGQMEPCTPRATSPASQKSNFDDLFEGEPDPHLFLPSSLNGFDAVAAWLTTGNSNGTDMQIETFEEPMFDGTNFAPMASGALGDGDIPYSESACRRRHESLAVCMNIDDDLPAFTRTGIPQQPSQERSKSELADEWIRRREHLASLEDEIFGQYRTEGATQDYDVYSATGSSESISEWDDDALFASAEKHQEAAAPRSSPAQMQQALSKSEDPTKRNVKKSPSNIEPGQPYLDAPNSESIHSALWHFKPHLSEVTPVDTQGHHPSVISRSSHSNKSRASSLVDELLGEEVLPLFSEVCHDDRKSSDTEINTGEARPPVKIGIVQSEVLSSINNVGSPPVSWHSLTSLVDNRNVSNTPSNTSLSVRQFDVKPPDIGKPSVPAPIDIESSHTIHSNINLNMPPSALSNISFQYNSARLTPPLRSPSISERGSIQSNPISMDAQVLTVCQVWPGVWERLEQDLSHNPWTDSQRNSPAKDVTVPILSSMLKSQDVPQPSLHTEESHKEVEPTHKHLDFKNTRFQGINALQASTTLDLTMPSPYSPPPAVPEPQENGSPSRSPLAGLQGAIHLAKRGSRKAATPRKATVNIVNTRGRAISASPSKRKITASAKSAAAAGVQGGTTKITKTRATKSARASSRKVTVTMKVGSSGKDDVPGVSMVPDGMDLDLPNLQLLLDAAQKQQQTSNDEALAIRRQELEAVATLMNMQASVDDGVDREEDFPRLIQPISRKPEIPSQMSASPLQIPKTRKSVKSNLVVTEQETTSNFEDDRLAAIITQLSEQKSTETEDHSISQRPISPRPQEPASYDKPEPKTPSPRKRPTTRTATPYRVQKLILRPPRIPAPIPAMIAVATKSPQSELNNASVLLIADTTVQPPETPTTPRSKSKPKPKPRTTPRKATPSPKKKKQTGTPTKIKLKVSKEVIPPVPPIPTTPNRRVTKNLPTNAGTTTSVSAGEDGMKLGLTPQSAERESVGSPSPSPLPTALRRSPRLSGVRPETAL